MLNDVNIVNGAKELKVFWFLILSIVKWLFKSCALRYVHFADNVFYQRLIGITSFFLQG